MEQFSYEKLVRWIIASGSVGVILGFILTLIYDVIKEKFKKKKVLKSLHLELQFNQGVVSWGYLYFKKLLKVPEKFNKKDKETLERIFIEFGLKKELGWGFKTSAYHVAESEGALIDLPCCGEIFNIYRIIDTLKAYGIPKKEDKVGWRSVNERLQQLEKSLNLVIDHFYDSKEEWIKLIRKETRK